MTKHLLVTRQPSAHGCTLGQLSLDGKYFCLTLEPGTPVIPAGTYPVTITKSPRLGIITPRLGGAVAEHGFLLHVGNTAKDTRGCILVGFAKLPSNVKIYQSQEAFEALMHQLLPATAITLTIR